ncbi:MAG: hypothetical protein N4A36_01700, partial [Candidatus Gracilibacteria bacterium]|nr:hypothetical protein [Candidatus Gracilibacteria bacterium]
SQDILELSNIESGTFVGLEKTSYIEKSYPTQIGEEVDTANLKQKDDLYINRYKEQTYFNLILISLGAFAELIIALILIFRYVIIWFLLIFSPFLFVLFIFPSLRSVFRYWIWLFSRWIMIGPILAMALFVVINIWVHTGIPLESSYQAPSSLVFINTTNLQIASPSGSGGLETPRNIMKYISSLMMLYLCILLPFWLTRIIPASISKDSFSSLQKSLESKSEQEHDIIRKIQEKIEESSISKSKTNSIITQALGLNKNSTVANFLNQEKQEEATKERLQQTQGLKTSSNKHLQNTQTKTQENELSSMLTKKEDQLEQKNDENQSIIKISTPSIKIQEDSTKQEQKEAQNKEIIKNTSKIDQASEKISEQQKTEIQKEIKSSNSIKSITEDKKITRESRKDQIKSQESITEKIKVERPEIRENKKIEDIIKEKESLKNKNKKTT